MKGDGLQFLGFAAIFATLLIISPLSRELSTITLILIGLIPGYLLASMITNQLLSIVLDYIRAREDPRELASDLAPPKRDQFDSTKILVGFDSESGEPISLTEEALTEHIAVYSRDGAAKTALIEAIALQQILKGTALIFLDAKAGNESIVRLTRIAELSGRKEDLILLGGTRANRSYNILSNEESTQSKALKLCRASSVNPDKSLVENLERWIRTLQIASPGCSIEDLVATLKAMPAAFDQVAEALATREEYEALRELQKICGPRASVTRDSLLEVERRFMPFAQELSRLIEADQYFRNQHHELTLAEAVAARKIIYISLPHTELGFEAESALRLFKADFETLISGDSLPAPLLFIHDESGSRLGTEWRQLCESYKERGLSVVIGAETHNPRLDRSADSRFYENILQHVGSKIMITAQISPSESSDWFASLTAGRRRSVTETTTLTPDSSHSSTSVHFDFSRRANIEERGEIPLKSEPAVAQAWFDLIGSRRTKGSELRVDGSELKGYNITEHLDFCEQRRVRPRRFAELIELENVQRLAFEPLAEPFTVAKSSSRFNISMAHKTTKVLHPSSRMKRRT